MERIIQALATVFLFVTMLGVFAMLTGCSGEYIGYSVDTVYKPREQELSHFECVRHNEMSSYNLTMAICPTREECNKVCDEWNKKKKEER